MAATNLDDDSFMLVLVLESSREVVEISLNICRKIHKFFYIFCLDSPQWQYMQLAVGWAE